MADTPNAEKPSFSELRARARMVFAKNPFARKFRTELLANIEHRDPKPINRDPQILTR